MNMQFPSPNCGRWARGALLFAAAFLCPLLAERGAAQSTVPTPRITQPNGFVTTLPAGRATSRTSGLRLEIDTRWLNNYGYRPVRFTVTSLVPTKAKHTIAIRLMAASWSSRSGDAGNIAVEQRLELPMGSKSAECVMSVPQYQLAARYWWEVKVDGEPDPDLSVAQNLAWNFSIQGTGKSATPAFLVVGPGAKSYDLIGPGSDLYQALTIDVKQLPARWINYTCSDAISLSPEDLQYLAKTNPEALQAIGLWVRAGGQLWVNPVGGEWEDLASVERLLHLNIPSDQEAEGAGDNTEPETKHDRGLTDDEVTARGWKPIHLVARKPVGEAITFIHSQTGVVQVVRDRVEIARMRRDPSWRPTTDVPENDTDDTSAEAESSPRDSTDWYLERPLGLGRVRIFRRAWDPIGFGISWRMLMGFSMPNPNDEPTPLTAAMESTRNWESRHGMTPDTANRDFANFLVPGVGQAPVSEFRVLITLFVVVIGPLNYWFLKRSGRLHLLVVTVPIVAALLTAGLFAYAILSDGFSTRVRIQSLTALDQRSGEAATWARLSYYAGLAPGRGLVMPDDVALYPIIPGWSDFNDRAIVGTLRLVDWRDGEERLTQGWLRSRTPTQYLEVRSQSTPSRLRLQSTGERLFGTNELGTPIRYVVAVDEQGGIFSGETIGEGERVELKPVDSADAMAPLRRLVSDSQPSAPPELSSVGPIFPGSRRRRQVYANPQTVEAGDVALSENLLGDAVAALIGPNGDAPIGLPPRSFAAITNTNPEVATGMPEAVEQASFHVIVGTW